MNSRTRLVLRAEDYLKRKPGLPAFLEAYDSRGFLVAPILVLWSLFK